MRDILLRRIHLRTLVLAHTGVTSPLEAPSADSRKPLRVVRLVDAQDLRLHSLLIVRQGTLVFDPSVYPYPGDIPPPTSHP